MATSQNVEWNSCTTFELLEVWHCVRMDRINGGNLRTVDFKTVAEELNTKLRTHGTPQEYSFISCRNKIDNLKRKYKQELEKEKQSGGTPSRWEYFEKCHELSFALPRYSGVAGGRDEGHLSNPLPHHVNPPFFPAPAPSRPHSRPTTMTAPALDGNEVIDLDTEPTNVNESNPPSDQPQAEVDVADSQCNLSRPGGPNVTAPAPGEVQAPLSPRSVMCRRQGVAGQTNKKRKTGPESMVAAFNSLTTALIKIEDRKADQEDRKLALFQMLLAARQT